MRNKLRANDDLRTRFRPSCLNKSLEVNDGIETLGVVRDGDFLVKQNRNPAISKHYRAIQRNESDAIRKSRREGCATPLFTDAFGTFCETRADGSGVCQPGFQGPIEAIFFHPILGKKTQMSTLGSLDIGKIKLGDWYHICLVRDKDFLALYINGQAVSATVDPLGNALKDGISNGLLIGGVRVSSWTPDAVFNGRIDQPCTWSRSLTPDEVAELYSGGSGIKFNSWSNDLKEEANFAVEFNDSLEVSGNQVVGNVLNLVDQSDVEVRAELISIPRNLLQPGKVSDFSFTPAFIDELAYPVADMQQAQAAVNDPHGNATPHQVLFFDDDFSTGESFSLSAWVSPHGMAYSKNTQNQLGDVNSGAFDLDGEMVQKTYGVIFSDYEGYNTKFGADANFTLSFRGTFKNDPNASLLAPPGRSTDFTALPDNPGKPNSFTAKGSEALIPNLSFCHSAMSENGLIVHPRVPIRFRNSANFITKTAGQRATKWGIEFSGHSEAALLSDDGLGGTLVGQDGSWGMHFNPENHEGFRPARNTFTPNNHLDQQQYYIVLSSPSLTTRFRWQHQTNNFEDRWFIFGTHEDKNGNFGVDVSLTEGLKNLCFRVMDEHGGFHQQKFPLMFSGLDTPGGPGALLGINLITLNINTSEDLPASNLRVNGNTIMTIGAKNRPPMVANPLRYRFATDAISIAQGPTQGTTVFSKPEHYLEMVLHELGQSSETTNWHSHTSLGAISAPVDEQVEGYLAHKWGISNKLPDHHAFKNHPPHV